MLNNSKASREVLLMLIYPSVSFYFERTANNKKQIRFWENQRQLTDEGFSLIKIK